jgi:hypothetical protein
MISMKSKGMTMPLEPCDEIAYRKEAPLMVPGVGTRWDRVGRRAVYILVSILVLLFGMVISTGTGRRTTRCGVRRTGRGT